MLVVYRCALLFAPWALIAGCGALLGIHEQEGQDNGASCASVDDCASGSCVDGVCCDQACSGACETCTSPEHPGHCLPSPADTPCGEDLACDGAGQCAPRLLELSEPCALDQDCRSGVCTDNVCCEHACDNDQVCTPEGLCRDADGTPCSSADECASGLCADGVCCAAPCAEGEVCGAGGVCRRLQGEPCSADAECESAFCADGVCCDQPCGTCARCDGARPGICAPVPRDSDPDNECGASCDGDGACREVVDVSVGFGHSCARLGDGAVKCWGDDALGQLGDGNGDATFATVKGLDGVVAGATQISAGTNHTCALLSGGSIRCWGDNTFGQLGNGAAGGFVDSPVQVTGFGGGQPGAVGVAAGNNHTCAWLASGAVRCWGEGESGKLGNGTIDSSSVPLGVSGINGNSASALSVSGGSHHTCAVLTGGSIRCWGGNTNGQLGDDTLTMSTTPVTVVDPGGAGFTAVAAGGFHTCAVATGGAVWCWGFNSQGQLGDGTTGGSSKVPVKALLSGVSATGVAAGGFFNCALLAPGAAPSSSVRCWGGNGFGQLGDGTTIASDTPVPAAVLDAVGFGALSLSTRHSHVCVTLASGAAHCWGANVTGQVGIPAEIGPKL
ncbi:MAG: hypothetical protein R3F14_30035 [Polyangiaceae bacterium]